MKLTYLSDSMHEIPADRQTPSNNKPARSVAKRIRNLSQAYRSWFLPYIKSRSGGSAFRPLLSFLYTDLNCNLNCAYCFSRGRDIPGMSMETARKAVDWLHKSGCRVLAYMGGEPLVRPDFIIALTRYATEKGFFVYLPTNGILMDEAFVEEIGQAGIAAINLAVDCLEPGAGLMKAFNRIERQFEYLVARENQYGYITFFNINITQNNIEDVKALTEIAHRYGIATDYHINEPPLMTYENYTQKESGGWITQSEVTAVDEIVDWLVEKNRHHYTMVNSVAHLQAMKSFIRHKSPSWPCRAGELSMVIRLDGSFSPCMEFYGSDEDWGSIYEGAKFDRDKLFRMKQDCSRRCLSTCNFQVSHYAGSMLHVFQWLAKHASAHMFGVS